VAFWSEAEARYVCYYRTWKRIGNTDYRWISRATSEDFLHWTPPVEMDFGDAPPEHLYTNQTFPYFRAPNLYLGLAARFLPGRRVLTEEQVRRIGVDPRYAGDCSDAVLLTSRGGARYDRTFREAFVRPGLGPANWVSRANYPALNIVPTGPHEMSFYVTRHYAQPSAHLNRYVLTLDRIASLHAGHRAGEAWTRPLRFRGRELEINYSTSAAGMLRIEITDAGGKPLPGYALDDCPEIVGDEIEGTVRWRGRSDVSKLAGQVVRLHVVLKDADLYALRFRP
ncbi:MAG: hypothetical protein ACPL88_01860, partial [Bryobacteraceae bacterium]